MAQFHTKEKISVVMLHFTNRSGKCCFVCVCACIYVYSCICIVMIHYKTPYACLPYRLLIFRTFITMWGV